MRVERETPRSKLGISAADNDLVAPIEQRGDRVASDKARSAQHQDLHRC